MVRSNDKEEELGPVTESTWTTDHHLVGTTTLIGSALRSTMVTFPVDDCSSNSRNDQGGQRSGDRSLKEDRSGNEKDARVATTTLARVDDNCSLTISAFQPENQPERKPALWRGLLWPTEAGFIHNQKLLASREEGQDQESTGRQKLGPSPPTGIGLSGNMAPASARGSLDSPPNSSVSPPVAIDRISTDLQQPASFSLVPPAALVRIQQARLQDILYQHVVSEYLPSLIMIAALEEVQQQFVRQKLQAEALSQQDQEQLQRVSTQDGSSLSYSVPKYYSQTPSSYLTAPALQRQEGVEQSSDSRYVVPLSFTPNQLTTRIKQGCTLVWEHYCNVHKRKVDEQLSITDSLNGAFASDRDESGPLLDRDNRRSSSRIARITAEQQEREQEQLTAVVDSIHKTDYSAEDKTKLYWKVTPGGRVATFLLSKLLTKEKDKADDEPASIYSKEHGETGDAETGGSPVPEEEVANDEKEKESEPPAPEAEDALTSNEESAPATPSKDSARMRYDENNNDQVDVMEEDDGYISATPEKSRGDDEDFSLSQEDEDNDDDDDEEEAVAGTYVKENLQNLRLDEEEEASSAGEDSSGEDDEDADALTHENPYLAVTESAILEWLGLKTAKLLTAEDLQSGFPSLLLKLGGTKKSKQRKRVNVGAKADEVLSSLDRKVLGELLGSDTVPASAIGGPAAKLVFQLATEHEDENVAKWETSYFGRTQFTLRVVDPRLELEVDEQTVEEFAAAEQTYKEQKAWDSWRYKGIHNGCSVWPSWFEAVSQWNEQRAKAPVQSKADSDGRVESLTTTDAPPPASNDLALAKRLADQEDTFGGGSRRTRRGGDSSGVFYGNQSNMTQKQLLDTVLRLTSEKGFHTTFGLVSAVADESTDPLRRIRTALGRLIWKRNQLASLKVNTEWTDGTIITKLREKQGLTALTDDGVNGPDLRLLKYIRTLHETELQLRRLVLDRLVHVPVAIVATAADERPGSMEAQDASYFEPGASIDWQVSGHKLLDEYIFRPAGSVTTERSPCYWYRVTDFCKSEKSSNTEEQDQNIDRPQIGSAKEPTQVERRCRFRVVRTSPPDEIGSRAEVMDDAQILTEAQVHAGMAAARLEQEKKEKTKRSENPFSNGAPSRVALFPPDGSTSMPIHGTVVGHDTVHVEDCVLHKILLLPDRGSPREDSFWVSLDTDDPKSIRCVVDGESGKFTIQQSDYHSSSLAFKACESIFDFLQYHAKAGPFLHPVDAVALNVPQYFDIVKNPMDISTLGENLRSGLYSIIPPNECFHQSPSGRMLNGPFRRDVELIFDNAMLFNPPGDWIHQAAASLKKAVLKKIDQATNQAEQSSYQSSRKSQSIYVDYDSDVDLYEYESDRDEEFGGSRASRKRKRGVSTVLKEDSAARAIERPFRLQKIISEASGLRGPFTDLPINSDASTFSLTSEWRCRHKDVQTETASAPDTITNTKEVCDEELDELFAIHRQMQDTQVSGLRRSTRSHDHQGMTRADPGSADQRRLEYFSPAQPYDGPNPSSRLEVEIFREKLHEEVYAKEYNLNSKKLSSKIREVFGSETGSMTGGWFPPYLGRVLPSNDVEGVRWEIRKPYVSCALRWVIRGLVSSGHLCEEDRISGDSLTSGAVLPNNVYYIDDREPFQVLDTRELIRRKRAEQEAEDESEDDKEMSEYEKLRAERVARNAERLKALGLA